MMRNRVGNRDEGRDDVEVRANVKALWPSDTQAVSAHMGVVGERLEGRRPMRQDQ